MTTEPTAAPNPDDVPEWVLSASDRPRRYGRTRWLEVLLGLCLLLFGVALVVSSLVLVVLEVREILTQPKVMGEESVVERIGWPLFPGLVGLSMLLPLWLDRDSIDE